MSIAFNSEILRRLQMQFSPRIAQLRTFEIGMAQIPPIRMDYPIYLDKLRRPIVKYPYYIMGVGQESDLIPHTKKNTGIHFVSWIFKDGYVIRVQQLNFMDEETPRIIQTSVIEDVRKKFLLECHKCIFFMKVNPEIIDTEEKPAFDFERDYVPLDENAAFVVKYHEFQSHKHGKNQSVS